MSPGNTMMRVYATLKMRLMEGEFAPGSRLDPAELRRDLASSTTPIRDALHRLAGEGLIETWQNEGFRAPQISEPAIRDFYEWSNELIHVVIRAAARRPDHRLRARSSGEDYAARVADTFHQLAALSANHEHRRVVANLCDRGLILWRAEHRVIDDVLADLGAIEQTGAEGDWAEAGRAIDLFHRRRLRVVPEIAASLRDRSAFGF
ncbi:MAG TPA: GntR family transcriptional regulator [Sphingomonas sp.]|nr:GntR family transcriptional regulator [Sphingomonas sp.]